MRLEDLKGQVDDLATLLIDQIGPAETVTRRTIQRRQLTSVPGTFGDPIQDTAKDLGFAAGTGIPLDEQKLLSGVAVDAVFDSVSVATTFRSALAEKGISLAGRVGEELAALASTSKSLWDSLLRHPEWLDVPATPGGDPRPWRTGRRTRSPPPRRWKSSANAGRRASTDSS